VIADRRPDPDALLARLKLDEERPRGGRLKIFFGASAGVGKTYAMLEEARLRLRDGVDVAVGYVETHRRKDTEALLEGLEIVPRREVEYRGIVLPELDLDAALARRPALVLVDELAHTNAPGSRHVKRWQDVRELLAAGIDVYSTVNAQHVESLNDLVARITGVRVRETVPDSVFERADEVELVDVSPEELLKRLADGKVYLPEQARRAAQSFFTRPNLTALRQIALRQVADRVDTQMQVLRRAGAAPGTWPVAERILVGIGPAPQSRRIVRAAKRMADRLGAEWIALFVETPESARWPGEDRARVWETMRLAEQLGARTATVAGADAAAELLVYARVHNVSKLVVGKPSHPRWRDRLFGSRLDAIVRQSGDVDVYVISGDGDEAAPPGRRRAAPAARGPVAGYLAAAAVVAACTGVGALMFGRFERTNLAMVYLLAVIAVSVRLGRGPSVLAAVLGVAAFDFFFVPPVLSFGVSGAEYLITFAVMLTVALVTSTLTARLREQGELSRTRERRTAALYEMGRDVVQHADVNDVLRAGAAHVRDVFAAAVTVFVPDARGTLEPWRRGGESGVDAAVDAAELAAARWVFANNQPAGAGTGSLPGARALYLPLAASCGAVGVLGVETRDAARFADPGQMHFLEAFANQLAVAVERARLAEAAVRAQQMREVDRLKSEFVSAASHELRAPLRALERSLAAAREAVAVDGSADAMRCVGEAEADAHRMRALADDLLHLSRLQAGHEVLELGTVDADALVADVVGRFGEKAAGRGIELEREVDGDVPPITGDRAAVERALAELLDAALALAADGGNVLVSADAVDGCVQLSVATSGAEIPPEAQTQVFDAFSPVPGGRAAERTGLGLAIAREIVRAHGGEIWVDSGPGPGAVFSFTLPAA
jgi:two-component system sensor histidine kinase KdpD